MEYPLQAREDASLNHIRSFALALWKQHFPQAVVGDVWKQEPNEQEREQGMVIVWQVCVYATPHDLQVYDERYRIANDYPEQDDLARYQAKRYAHTYEERMGPICYHGAFLGESQDGTLCLLSTIEDVERLKAMDNPYRTLTLHEKDIQTLQEALTMFREQKEGTEYAIALNELWSDIDNQRAGEALPEQVICKAVKSPTQAGLSFSYSHYDCVVLTNEQYHAMGGSEGRGKTTERWKGIQEETGCQIELWFRLKSAMPFDMKCSECGTLIHKAITEG